MKYGRSRTATWTTRLSFTSTMKNAKTGRTQMSSVCRKSQAQIAWFRRKVDQALPATR